MRTLLLKSIVLAVVITGSFAKAQENTNSMRAYLAPEKYDRNIFEDPKVVAPEYDGVKVTIGGDFALQYQGVKHWTEGATTAPLISLENNFNLPTANLDVNAYLAKGVKMHLRTYLSARHHNEAWVKGGYIQIDNLDFISPGFLGDIMKNTRVKIGMDEINYGDSHFRRTDNAEAINNSFVGNLIMDNFSTEAFGEVYYYKNGFIGMLGISNGKLNQSVIKGNNDNKASIYGKIGYDKQIDDKLRVRLTGSFYTNQGLNTGTYLYSADRAGSRYYYVLLTTADATGTSNQATGRFNPGFRKNTAFQINPFVKYQGLEFFGTFENVSGYKIKTGTTLQDTKGSYTQLAAELLYRFGGKEQYYIGGKYNTISGKDYDGADSRKIDRLNFGGGWYMTKNILAKIEYVNQKYDKSTAWGTNTTLYGGKFNGIMMEATIGF